MDGVSWLCFLAGGFLVISGGVGLVRLPDLFSRIHSAGVTETLGAPLMLAGLVLQLGWSLEAVKALFIIAFILATNPTASHAMARAALHGGYRPRVEHDDGEGPPSRT